MSDCILFINDSMIPPIFSPFEYDSNNPCHRRIFCPGPSMLVIKLLQETKCTPAQNPKALVSSRPAPRNRPTLQSSRSISAAPPNPPAFMPALPNGLIQRLLTKRKSKNTQPDAVVNSEPLITDGERTPSPTEFKDASPEAYTEPIHPESLTADEERIQNPTEFMDDSPEVLPEEAATSTDFPEMIIHREDDPEGLQYPSSEAGKELPLQASERRSPTGISIQEGLRRGNRIDLYYGNEYVGSGLFLYLGFDYLIWTDGEAIQVQVLDDPITIVKK